MVLLLCVSGCSLTNRVAVGQMVPIVQATSDGARESFDLEMIEQALPANILLIDGLVRTSPKNRDLLAIASFLNFGYALGFVEVRDPERALHYYERGRDYGLQGLDQRKEFARKRNGDLHDFELALATLRRKDVPALAWAAANWGRWISMNLESPAAIAQQPRFEALLARLIELEADYEGGLPHVLHGVYYALRPEMFGGDPVASLASFEKGFAVSERQNLLYLVLYAEYYCRQRLDEECFDSTLDEIDNAPDDLAPQFRLMNEIAKRRAQNLRARRDELF